MRTAILNLWDEKQQKYIGIPAIVGKDGDKGEPGKDGNDGISPSVVVSSIEKGHRVTITDAEGEHIFDVRDGIDGEGAGDMVAADYDPENVVDAAGGIPGYVAAQIEAAFDGIKNAEEGAY